MRPLARIGVAAVLAASASPAFAQNSRYGYDQGAGAPPPSTYDRGGYDRGGSQGAYDRSAPQGYDRGGAPGGQGGYDQGDAQAPDLGRELNLRPDQRAAYQAYQQAFAPDEARMRQEEDEQRRMPSLNALQRLDAARAAMERDRADFERTDAATRRFYAVLSADQRRTFDRLTAPPADGGDGDQDGGAPDPRQGGRSPR